MFLGQYVTCLFLLVLATGSQGRGTASDEEDDLDKKDFDVKSDEDDDDDDDDAVPSDIAAFIPPIGLYYMGMGNGGFGGGGGGGYGGSSGSGASSFGGGFSSGGGGSRRSNWRFNKRFNRKRKNGAVTKMSGRSTYQIAGARVETRVVHIALNADKPRHVIKSPHYPRNYRPRTTSTWIVTAPRRKRVHLKCKEFNTEEAKDCKKSTVLRVFAEAEASEADDPDSPYLEFCGEQKADVVSQKNRMIIQFKSKRNVKQIKQSEPNTLRFSCALTLEEGSASDIGSEKDDGVYDEGEVAGGQVKPVPHTLNKILQKDKNMEYVYSTTHANQSTNTLNASTTTSP